MAPHSNLPSSLFPDYPKTFDTPSLSILQSPAGGHLTALHPPPLLFTLHFRPQFHHLCHASYILVHSKSLLSVPWQFILLFIFPFLRTVFYFLSRWSILTYYLNAHKTHKISTKPSLHSLVSSLTCFSTSRRWAQGLITLGILLAAYVVSSFHTSLQLILSTGTVAIHLKGMSDLVSLQLKTFHWVIRFNPDEALHHPACVTSLTSSPTTTPPAPASLAGCFALHWIPQTTSWLWAFALAFSLPETFISK